MNRTTLQRAAAALLLGLLASQAHAEDPSANEIRVIDGDTVEWRGTHYRLAHWDAPEIFRPKCIGERRKGRAATARLREMIDAAGAIEFANIQPEPDFFGRTVADLVLDGRVAGAMLAAEGLAKWSDDGSRQDWCTFVHPPRD